MKRLGIIAALLAAGITIYYVTRPKAKEPEDLAAETKPIIVH